MKLTDQHKYAIAVTAVTLGFGLVVLPFLMVGYVVGWVWCGLVDGFTMARTVYEQYREVCKKLDD